ncbi:MAG: hypothetical protein NTV68_03350 [Methanomicrobiales archaeon]|nr:hypothetical protein [Methanomicrobiales archaeon]
MPGQKTIIAYIITLTAATIIVLQTIYRTFYDTFPWSVNEFHTVKYKASLGFIHPDSLTFWILLTGIILALVILFFPPVKQEHSEMVNLDEVTKRL